MHKVNLGDYLGQLLSEISMARMHADLETVRLAELYASHPLLRTMPVPHMRLPEVDLDIPVLVKAPGEPRAGESVRGGLPAGELRRQFDQVLAKHLAKEGVVLAPPEQKAMSDALEDRLARFTAPTEIAIDVNRVADELSSTALHVLRGVRRPLGAPVTQPDAPIEAEFKNQVRKEFLKLRTPPPRLSVLVTSAEIREAGTAENVTRLRLKVSEQGVEWTTIESEGVKRDQLIPE